MSFILLIIGIVLFYIGRIQIGSLHAEGRQVKAAGVILTLPAMLTLLLLNFFVPLVAGPSFDAVMTAVGLVSLLELIGMLIATALAYILIADPPGAPHLPGILGDIQDEARKHRSAPSNRPTASRPGLNLSMPPIARPRLNRESFPTVMTLKEAARYLRTSETEVLRLIDEGKLPASRDNFTYKIARSQLDQLR